jgi:hypothetical protein
MLPEMQDALRRLLYEHGRIPQSEVDIYFGVPTKNWAEGLMRPTINLFLFDIRENIDLRKTSFEAKRVDGRAQFHMPPRRIDLHYMVSALTSEIEDEHRLLWRVLQTLLHTPELPGDLLPDDMRRFDLPLVTRVVQPDDSPRTLEVWSALNMDPRSALHYVLTVPLDIELAIDAPLVLTRTLRYKRDETSSEEHIQIGGIVRDAAGAPLAGITVAVDGSAVGALTNADGAFVLRSVSSGPVPLRVTLADGAERVVTFTVPADSYEIVL